MSLMNCDKDIEYHDARMGDVRRHLANVLKAKDLLFFQHKIGMEEGLKKTIEYYYGTKI
jgi:nucleoside-diphosphate-sugar epimerase